MRARIFDISFSRLTRFLSTFRAAIFLTWISSLFILHIFMKLLFSRFFLIFFFFCSFMFNSCIAFFLISFSFFISDLNRLRDILDLFNFFNLVCRHICNSVFLRIVSKIISLILVTNESNFSARIESLHCMNFWIFDLHWWFKSYSTSTIFVEWVWRDDKDNDDKDNKNWFKFVIWLFESWELNFFNCWMHVFELTDHILDFWNACRIVDALNVWFLILIKFFRN
jgi:hypothetical protein